MQPIDAVISAFKNYVNFSGRASRGDYWWYCLGYILIIFLLGILDKVLLGGGSAQMDMADGVRMHYGAGPLAGIWILANIIPLIAAGVRRLHDGDRSGWWYLLCFVPLANLYLLYLFIIKGTAGENRFGADPVAQP